MNNLVQFLAVGIAGFCGAISRYALAKLCGQLFGTAFPVGTFIINVTGSLGLGWLMTYAPLRAGFSDTVRLAIGVGFLGAFTTFSTWMYESNKQLADGAGIQATVNILGSVVVGLVAIRLGIWMGSR